MLMVHVVLTPASACGVGAVNDPRLNVLLKVFTVASQHADTADFPLEIVLDLPVDDVPIDDAPVDVLRTSYPRYDGCFLALCTALYVVVYLSCRSDKR